jgi:hypothetical protein
MAWLGDMALRGAMAVLSPVAMLGDRRQGMQEGKGEDEDAGFHDGPRGYSK